MSAALFLPNFAGALLALLAAAITVLYDCHVSIQDRLKRVPLPIYRAPEAVVLAPSCGAIAAIAFQFTDGKGDTLIDSILGLKQSNPYLRGLCVGLTVLVLIRSKLSSIKGAPPSLKAGRSSADYTTNEAAHWTSPATPRPFTGSVD
jgi:hypothetical protein